jgi:hypothetical protein
MCNGNLIDEGKARDYTPHQLPPVGSRLNVHPFKEAGETGPVEMYKVIGYEFNIHRSWNNSYTRDNGIIHVERVE